MTELHHVNLTQRTPNPVMNQASVGMNAVLLQPPVAVPVNKLPLPVRKVRHARNHQKKNIYNLKNPRYLDRPHLLNESSYQATRIGTEGINHLRT